MKDCIISLVIVLAIQADLMRAYSEPYTWTTIAGSSGIGGLTDGLGMISRFEFPSGIAADREGNFYVADSWNGAIRKLTPAGTNWFVSTVSTNFSYPKGIAIDQAGNLFIADYDAKAIFRLKGGGTNWASESIFGAEHGVEPSWVAIDKEGNLYVTDSSGCYVEKISPSGTNWIGTIIAGKPGNFGSVEGTNSEARFGDPEG